MAPVGFFFFVVGVAIWPELLLIDPLDMAPLGIFAFWLFDTWPFDI